MWVIVWNLFKLKYTNCDGVLVNFVVSDQKNWRLSILIWELEAHKLDNKKPNHLRMILGDKKMASLEQGECVDVMDYDNRECTLLWMQW